jgi:hypothetical protein
MAEGGKSHPWMFERHRWPLWLAVMLGLGAGLYFAFLPNRRSGLDGLRLSSRWDRVCRRPTHHGGGWRWRCWNYLGQRLGFKSRYNHPDINAVQLARATGACSASIMASSFTYTSAAFGVGDFSGDGAFGSNLSMVHISNSGLSSPMAGRARPWEAGDWVK